MIESRWRNQQNIMRITRLKWMRRYTWTWLETAGKQHICSDCCTIRSIFSCVFGYAIILQVRAAARKFAGCSFFTAMPLDCFQKVAPIAGLLTTVLQLPVPWKEIRAFIKWRLNILQKNCLTGRRVQSKLLYAYISYWRNLETWWMFVFTQM